MSPSDPDHLAIDDDEELQLPMLGLFADLELGRGSVLLPDEFLHCPGLVQLRIIEQWQVSLARYRTGAMRLLQDESGSEAGLADHADLPRAACMSAGIGVTPDPGYGPQGP